MKATELKSIFHKELDDIYGRNEVESFFFLCTEFYLDLPRFQLALQPEFTLTKSEYDDFFNALEKLKQQEPIQYILGETEFYGLKFKVNKKVLIPRQETEELVDWILSSVTSSVAEKSFRVLDIGTGSGCIAISLAKNLPNAEVFALDVSEEALEVAKQNAEINEVKVQFLKTNILDEDRWNLIFDNLEFDVVVSNPPYVRNLEKKEIKPNVLDNEPHLALFVEDNNPLQFYKAITNYAINNLKPNGHLFFEINQYLGNETKQLLLNLGFVDVELRQDLNGNDRMLVGVRSGVIPEKSGIKK
ncbi:peptide chain release factor N(5)-glutamine methyltransferase [Winogradskyella ursingii]|uniref:peptide chain release factor N(5)-glutamine methyltransferase n=1 Tax=Winogradskyella ursingii TaxID=2686079 RepID=UPI0015C985BD|nr:peptide chain release factor N(5)-glutamine methyltransferase [Winogradskyella ursingii]